MCGCRCAQLSHTTQSTVLIIFALILQTITIAHVTSTGGEGGQGKEGGSVWMKEQVSNILKCILC